MTNGSGKPIAGLRKLYIISILTVTMLLHGCGGNADYTANDRPNTENRLNDIKSYSAIPSDSDAGSTSLFESEDETENNPFVIYRDLLEKYKDVVVEGKEWDPSLELGDPAFFIMDYYDDAGYLIRDLNHDGIDELLIGCTRQSVWQGTVYVLYTIMDGKPCKVFESYERSRYALLTDGAMRYEGSGSADDYVVEYYAFNAGDTQLTQSNKISEAENETLAFIPFSQLPIQNPTAAASHVDYIYYEEDWKIYREGNDASIEIIYQSDMAGVYGATNPIIPYKGRLYFVNTGGTLSSVDMNGNDFEKTMINVDKKSLYIKDDYVYSSSHQNIWKMKISDFTNEEAWIHYGFQEGVNADYFDVLISSDLLAEGLEKVEGLDTTVLLVDDGWVYYKYDYRINESGYGSGYEYAAINRIRTDGTGNETVYFATKPTGLAEYEPQGRFFIYSGMGVVRGRFQGLRVIDNSIYIPTGPAYYDPEELGVIVITDGVYSFEQGEDKIDRLETIKFEPW